ncbi:rhodanese-like domain-containing protein [Shouchella clausii]|jgi:rhodanese-related sulfurtransferase|uniref:Sulfurtransferase n=1 Tax=Shouchella clausii TaxID=79880 RepID=A0A268RX17_SHOCL|nr:rhodanese-like domain-containing protein [Shouchella clausii]PAD43079.1 sulfurtransferase [Bacillus sp. 7520-S]SPU20832.1 rhodanese domain containing protein [Niallia circulans]AST97159.1 sulfurtransferase [Shouchella clausii]MBU8594697.1 rhodanese-like domain-containing protein [Shouchella clausii]MCM3547347.1 rhodanese-like domain-containing protein [Shouchella clausii]
MARSEDGIVQLSTEEMKSFLINKADEPIIIDVREVEEYENGHLPGVPLIPMNEIPSMVAGMDQSKSYVLVCRSGRRSQNTALYLKEQGFSNVRNYEGGMLAWDGELEYGQEWVVKDVEELYK